ncbi:helix-turn-helix domain-containing protein [Dactylosporangium sp. NPDC051541]|uniref:helix-turn-helix domain-containing protein n=1 Tax=Dactylosporangium sp. NPDC051541 TaxID=3363977 RepID=UPI0037BB313F
MTERASGWSRDDRRRRLADELKRARTRAGMSGRDLGQKIDISQSKISRIEAGTAVPSLPEVRLWADAVDATDELREMLFALTDAAHGSVQRWWPELATHGHLQDEIEATERGAARILTFQSSVVPGLLQTADYARRIFELFEQVPYGPDELAQALAARLDRQLLLFDESRTFLFLITEGALRWRPGPPMLLAAQLDRISTLSTLDNVTIGLLPLAAQAVVPYSHAFTIYEPADGELDTFVSVEMIHGNLHLRHEPDIVAYQRRWTALDSNAVYGEEARRLLHDLISEMRTAR